MVQAGDRVPESVSEAGDSADPGVGHGRARQQRRKCREPRDGQSWWMHRFLLFGSWGIGAIPQKREPATNLFYDERKESSYRT
jgi:hypothetical protein